MPIGPRTLKRRRSSEDIEIYLAHCASGHATHRETLASLEKRLRLQGHRLYCSLSEPLEGSLLHGIEERLGRARVALIALNQGLGQAKWLPVEVGLIVQRRNQRKIRILAFWIDEESVLPKGIRSSEVVGILKTACAADLDRFMEALCRRLSSILRRRL